MNEANALKNTQEAPINAQANTQPQAKSLVNIQKNTHNAPRLQESELTNRLVPVIVGGTFLAYSYVREFHRAYGITRCIVVLTSEIKMLTKSRFTDCRIIENAGEPEGLCTALEDIAAELAQEGAQGCSQSGSQSDPQLPAQKDASLVPLVLGCDDRHALIFAQYKERLEAAGYIVVANDYDMLSCISNKHHFYDLCEKLDIPCPKTWYFSCGDDAPESLPVNDFPYPLIAKPTDTTQFQNTNVAHKRKAYEVETPEELARIWQNIKTSSYSGELIIQDYIPGGDEALRILNTFSDKQGNMRVVSGGIVCLQDHSPAALGNPLCIIGEREQEIIECAKRFLKHTKYESYGNFDIKYDERTKKFCFFEINIRAGRSSYFTSLGGINFVSLIVDQYVLGKEVKHAEAYEPFVYNCVPKYVLKKSIHDKDQLSRALSLLKTNKLEAYPLNYKPDTLSHAFWSYVMYFNQIRKFKRYFWDTQGKQFKA